MNLQEEIRAKEEELAKLRSLRADTAKLLGVLQDFSGRFQEMTDSLTGVHVRISSCPF